jgi:hypothetical protein
MSDDILYYAYHGNCLQHGHWQSNLNKCPDYKNKSNFKSEFKKLVKALKHIQDEWIDNENEDWVDPDF